MGSSAPNAWLMGPRSAVGFGAALATFSLLLTVAWYGSEAAFRYLEPFPLARTAVFTRLGAREPLRRGKREVAARGGARERGRETR